MKLLAILLATGVLGIAQDETGKTKTGAIVGNVISVGFAMEQFTGAPFAAESTYARVRILPDGTRVEQPVTSAEKVYRDGQGRVRSETIYISPTGERILSMITIADPIDEFHYTLDPKNRIAHRMKAQVNRFTPEKPRPPMGPSGPNVTRQPIGLQIVNGVPAQGELATLTIPAGTGGNDRPIIETFEIWTAVELQWTVRQVIRSPLRGEQTNEWINISRQEPDPNLFRIPSDYQISDDKGPYFIGR